MKKITRHGLWTKGLVVGLIILFVGTSILPNIIGTIQARNDPAENNDISPIFEFVEIDVHQEEPESYGISSFSNSIQSFSTSNDTTTLKSKKSSSIANIDGQILFAPVGSTITYLVNTTGEVNHTWSSSYLPGEAVYWLGDGTILRTIRIGVGPGTGGAGGGIQKIQWDGTVIWDFRYNTNGHLSHHDIEPLPNGNVLMIAWETKTRAEAIAAGRNPSHVSISGFYPDHIIEVHPTGPTSGTIVWEWHVWDHLIQDYDSSKANYGIISDHPELVDINYGASYESDWLHSNSVDYNEQFNQIMISVRNFNEIWVIDHSTTTAEAAGHTGGNSGKGGDLLYRWGNPVTYQAGPAGAQKFFFQHDATWIDNGCPGAGHILVFNNGINRPDGMYSSVDEVAPPVNEQGEYYRALGSAYGPTYQTAIYTMDPPTSFYSDIMSGAERLRNGNILICSGHLGRFFEMTPAGEKIWEYSNASVPTGYVFKIDYVPSEEEPPNRPPNTPCFPYPIHQATGIDVTALLSWECDDPDSNPVTFDVYFGTTSLPPKVETNQSSFSYNPGILTYDTIYNWRIVAWDIHGLSTEGPLWWFTTSTNPTNHLPHTPSNPHPPDQETNVNTNINLSWSGGDPDMGDIVTYDVYFGSELPIQKVANNISAPTYSPGLLVNNVTYFWNIVAWDNHGASDEGPGWRFTTTSTMNNPPTTPSQPLGQTDGKIGQEYQYSTSTTDPNDDQVFYLWDWGDGNNSGWLGPYDSGDIIETTHTWTAKGSYSIKVKAKDIYGHEGSWSDPLPITMPYTYKPVLQFLELLFERFPHAFPILRQLFGY